MKLYQLVIKDVLRRKRRVLYATLGVVIGTMTVVGILTVAQAGQQRIYDQLEKYGANLIVVPATKSLDTGLRDLNLGTVTVGSTYIQQDKLGQIRSIADGEIRKALNLKDEGNIATIAPKLFETVEMAGNSLTLVGIDIGEELKVKTWWQVHSGRFPETDNEILLGMITAETLILKPGDSFELENNRLIVAGILEETGSDEDYQAFMPLATMQQIYNKQGLISSVDIRALCNACPAEYIADSINRDIPGVRAVAVKQVAATEMGMLERINLFMLALAGITLIVGAFGVVNTLLTSIHERIKDIGIMRAVGASRRQIIIALIYEAVIIGIAGGILGYGAGSALAYAIRPLIFDGANISLVPEYLLLSLSVAIIISVSATLYPAYRATQIRVADSFRSL